MLRGKEKSARTTQYEYNTPVRLRGSLHFIRSFCIPLPSLAFGRDILFGRLLRPALQAGRSNTAQCATEPEISFKARYKIYTKLYSTKKDGIPFGLPHVFHYNSEKKQEVIPCENICANLP